ncbi:MAG: glutamate--cysteine ligase [Candidatus Omnitrophica bacterium]|nr:glutamate--cysteine ligase [Candidatus Omnitrophota bacterium]MDE2222439.1 glutamate--cysteine ligase [Candidatus Omnitrophota bacterium]
MKLTVNQNFSQSLCVPCIQQRQGPVHQWLLTHEKIYTPFYTSVDIRDAGFKIAVVDCNLFPGGFNNLCEHGLADAEIFIKKAILSRVPDASSILIVAEEHTRNTWYLENVRILQEVATKAGFNAQIASFFINEPSFCAQAASAIELETASGRTVKIHCIKRILDKIKRGSVNFDMIIMNNDLSAGIPEDLKQVKIPIFPPVYAGWHTRLKSEHFHRANNLVREFAGTVGLDPWQFSCLYEVENHVDINAEADQKRLYQTALKLFENIQSKYTEHGVDSKPFIFLKSDSGTYGLGVVPIEDPQQILELNRKKRNDLARGKDAQTITHFLLQEGVPTIHRLEDNPCEVCLYQIDNNFVGGFYRYHGHKNDRESLNAPGGMSFQKMCPHLDKYGRDCGIIHNINIFDIYRILGRIAGAAAGQEIMDLKARALNKSAP